MFHVLKGHKYMSTKTSFKRIALVAASALAIAGFSAVPANATTAATNGVVTTPSAAVAVAGTASSTFTATVGIADTGGLTASLTRPTGSTVSLTDNNGANSVATNDIFSDTGKTAAKFADPVMDVATGAITFTAPGPGNGGTGTVGTLTIIPDVAGTYVLTITDSAAATMTFTVTAGAGELPSSQVTALTAAAITATPTQGALVEVKFGMTLAALTASGGNSTDYFSVKAALTSYPTGGSVAVTSQLAAAYTTTTAATPIVASAGTTPTIAAVANTSTVTGTLATEDTTAWSAQTKTNIAGFKFTPTKAGTYVMTVWRDYDVDDVIDPTEVQQTTSIVVAAASGYSPSLSTIYAGTGATVATSTTDLLPISSTKTAGAGQAANIRVALKNSVGAAYTGQSVTATVSGPGLIKCASVAAADTAEGNATGTLRAETVSDTNGFVTCRLDPDGTAGTSTVSIAVTDQVSGATTVLGSKSVTFYGSVAKLTATAYKTVGKASGGATGGSVTGATATNYLDLKNRVNSTDIPAVVIKATDSAGNPVGGLVIGGKSSDVTKVNSWTAENTNDDATEGCSEDVLSAANVYSSGGTGFYNCAFTTPSSAKSGDKATLTFRILDPSDPDGVAYLTADVAITIGSTTVATETLSFDKTSYAPGEAMVITRTAVDASGNPVADETAAPAVSFSKAVGGTAPGDSTYTAGKKVTSATAPSVFAPAVSGDFTAYMTSGNAAGSTITATATVEGDASASLALDAANAATDAANNAYDEAQNATQAASDALAAVTALAAQVKSLIASVKKLTAAVAKLKK